MSKFAGLAAGAAVGLGAVAVAAVVAVAALTGRPDAPEETLRAVVVEPDAAPSEADQADQDALRPDPAPAPTTAPAPEARADAAPPKPPSIDTFRLDPDGTMLVAGQAEPGWQTMVLVDGKTLAEAELDGQGKFVSFLTLEQSADARILSLVMRKADTPEIVSLEEIIIAPVIAEAAPLTAAPEGAPEQSTTERAALTAPQSQAVLRSTQEGVEVIQPATPADPPEEVTTSVALDAITYSETGEVALAGRAEGDGFVRVYIDNRPIITTQIETDGNWRTELPEVDTGVYTLRVDEVDAEGQVTSRVETPFQREEKTTVAESFPAESAPDGAQVAVITVQPGSTLWAISRERYGEGLLYVRVFEANKDRIRNPDLIYPGQIFTLPD